MHESFDGRDGRDGHEGDAGREARGEGLGQVSRRRLLQGGGLVAALTALEALKLSAAVPVRAAVRADSAGGGGQRRPDVQFDIADYIAPVQTIDGIAVQYGPVHTVFATAQLLRRPTVADQRLLRDALAAIERAYPFSPEGIFVFVAYGLPYFRRLRGGLDGDAFRHRVPRLAADARRFVLEEAIPGPTDVSPANPGISKERFNVPVAIEGNDLLFTFRSDDAGVIQDVLAWLGGSGSLAGKTQPSPRLSGLLEFTSSRAMFAQPGLPRKIADRNGLPYAFMVNPDSPMWMGFVDQHQNGSSPAAPLTFQASELAFAAPGDYFDNGAIQHLSHVIMDLPQFYDLDATGTPGDDGIFSERVQYMFRSTPPPSTGNTDQYTDGGGPAYLENSFQGTDDADRSARGIGTPGGQRRLGHLNTLQRTSRDRAGRPLHLRMDGPGYDAMDVPDGSAQPKLQFTIFVPTADFFATMRRSQASLDLAKAHDVQPGENGLERFLTATRRQNFLVPPRRHRAFPLVELD